MPVQSKLPLNLKSLTEAEIESYRTKGFTKTPHQVFTETDYRDLKSNINRILELNGGNETSKALGAVHTKNPELLLWLLSDNILNIIEDVLGPNIGFFSSSIFYKKAHSQEKAYWHQDTGQLNRFNLFEDSNLVNLTLSLCQNDRENGCLRFIPESHKGGLAEHDWQAPKSDLITNSLSISDHKIDVQRAEYMELKENEASLHNIYVIHGSEPNCSSRDRLSLSARFFSASSKCNLKNFDNNFIKPIPFLVRGRDAAGSGLKSFQLKKL